MFQKFSEFCFNFFRASLCCDVFAMYKCITSVKVSSWSDTLFYYLLSMIPACYFQSYFQHRALDHQSCLYQFYSFKLAKFFCLELYLQKHIKSRIPVNWINYRWLRIPWNIFHIYYTVTYFFIYFFFIFIMFLI